MKLIHVKSIILILLLLELSSFAQSESKKLDKYFLGKKEKAGIIGMQIGYLKDGQLSWKASYGVKNYKTNAEVNDSSLFMIASCSKPLTALALMKLYDEGKLELDKDISNYLPFEIRNPYFPDQKITSRTLLSHTSSLKDNWEIMEPLYTLDEGGDSPILLSDFVKDYFCADGWYFDSVNNFFNKKPGEFWSYSNMGYTLIGYIIEQVSGLSFSEYMQEEIFEPLEMNNSYWFLSEIPHNNIASPHDLPDNKSDSISPKIYPHYGYPDFPDGQLRTTVSDYSKFLALLLNNGELGNVQFIKSKTINLILDIQYPEVNKWQAIAWNYNEFENWLYYLFMPHLPSHTGGDPGVATVVSINPKENTGAIVFVNSPPNTFRAGKIFYLDMIKKLLKEAEKQD